MKNRIIFTVLFLSLVMTLQAKPAKRTIHTLTQPDGTKIVAIAGGDEYCSYFTNISNGKRLKQKADGFWMEMTNQEVELQDYEANTERIRRKAARESYGGLPTTGDHKHLLILVEFSNLKFSEIGTKERFNELANGENYTFQGATGSVKQYYKDQSFNSYNPTFDVIGPICVDNDYQYYGKNNNPNGNRTKSLVIEAIKLAYDQGLIKDLSQYDHDEDGYVDLVYMITAGYSAAEDQVTNADYPWPHQWSVNDENTYKNEAGVTTKIRRYAFSTELMGLCTDKDLQIDAIGSMCHEFGHALGLPDFYNTGNRVGCYGMDYWSLMDVGDYLNDGKTPPSLTAYERSMLDWCELEELPSEGTVTLKPFCTGNKAYIYRNPNKYNECLTFEYHSREDSWDKYWGRYSGINHGMMILHVDYNANVWANNQVNNDPNHQLCTLLPADSLLIAHDNYDVIGYTDRQYLNSFKGDIFPGRSNVTELNSGNPAFKWFNGKSTGDGSTDYSIGFSLSNINDSGSELTFQVGEAVTAIRGIKTEVLAKGVFDLNGKKIADNIDDVDTHGMYIVKNSDGTSRIVTK